jgi:hypothetical protein
MHPMVQSSNNEAVTLCIEDIGFQYINGALEAEGFVAKGGLGIWIGLAFRMGSTPWGFPPVTGTFQSATPDALAMLLVALDMNSLITTGASAAIVNMLKGSGSWMREAFKSAKVATTVDFAKDGLGDDKTVFSDIGVCTKTVGTRYAAVILRVTGQTAFNTAAVGVDGCF